MASKTQRKLAAILCADVAGYSRLMGADEEATIATLTAYRKVFLSQIENHHGRVVDAKGDAILAEFGSVVDAVNGAMAIQRELGEKNAALPNDRRMNFRIGINLGDVVVQDDVIYGDGVNVAARLESLAEPGGVCISGSAYDQVRNKLKAGFESLGEQRVKNIAEPVRAYKVLLEPGPPPTRLRRARRALSWNRRRSALGVVVAAGLLLIAVLAWTLYQQQVTEKALAAFQKETAFPLPNEPSIAVLAFDNLSGDPEQEYLSEGLSEIIITKLAGLSQLFVIARNSAFRYKGKAVDVRQVGRELGVRYVLEGSVQKAGGRIRVAAQLIDAATGKHLWAEKYDRKLDDLFAIQDEITRKVVTQLEIKLTMGEHARVIAYGTNNVGALENLLQARALFLRFEREGNLRSRKLAKKATEIDPKFAWALAQEGWTYYLEAAWGWSDDRAASVRQAEAFARRALAIDANVQYAHTLLSRVHALRGELDEAIVEGRRAIELSPGDSYPMSLLSAVLVWAGQNEEALALIKKALRLQPYPDAFQFFFAGNAYYFLGRYEKAIPWYRKYLERQPRGGMAQKSRQFLIGSLVELGRTEEARAEVRKLLAEHPKFSVAAAAKLVRAAPFKDFAFLDRHLGDLRKAGLPE